jgi:uncharacterized protein
LRNIVSYRIGGEDRMDTSSKLTLLKKNLRKHDSLLIAYSGGVDSGLLAVVAREVLGDRAHCVLLDGPEVPRRAVEDATKMADALNLSCEVIPYPIMEIEGFRKNFPDRCYHCRKGSAQILREKACDLGIAHIADGINASDLGEHRPGVRASTEEGILHPFVDAGITKADIRAIAKKLNLPFWNKPSAACTSSRVPYGEEITVEKLRRIEKAENYLCSKGFSQVRVRSHGAIARIEVPEEEMPRLLSLRRSVAARLKALGFPYVALDLTGYRSGSMDEVLPGKNPE